MPAASPDSGREGSVVSATGVVQGVVLVTFPAASAIFTAQSQYGLSSTLYGSLFLPQVLLAIAAALVGSRVTGRFGSKRIYQAGLTASLIAMILLFGSRFLESDRATSYTLLLVSTALVGAGFGLTVPTLNALAAALHQSAVDRATLVLNALLGVGTALAPVFVAVFVGLRFWWGLPLLSALTLAILLVVSSRLALKTDAPGPANPSAALPARFWLFALIALLYGVIETMSGNWAGTFLTRDAGGSALAASVALTSFWASVTIGRILFAAIQRRVPGRWVYRLIPLLVAVSYLGIATIARSSEVFAVVGFALAGLGCSTLLPLTISFSEKRFRAASVSGTLIAFYQVGFGVAAFGVGPLLSLGASLSGIFGFAGVAAVVIATLAFAAEGRHRSLPSANLIGKGGQ